ncbi:hypothetical protein CAMSH0001_1437 [Campylobacter showae RM3277]|uniref:Uncharacterized protein n=1 Tax=Campylobacter showae RM3277 TaxID=553219 RepID=C6RIU0_9BACT|nr:hypothetical protein CAMSH0001_1437 [Campylobacter showae RM3277]
MPFKIIISPLKFCLAFERFDLKFYKLKFAKSRETPNLKPNLIAAVSQS